MLNSLAGLGILLPSRAASDIKIRMIWAVLIFLTGACWYLVLSKRKSRYPRDWRLKPFDLTEQEEQEFLAGARKVLSLTGAIFFSVCLIMLLVFAFVPR